MPSESIATGSNARHTGVSNLTHDPDRGEPASDHSTKVESNTPASGFLVSFEKTRAGV
jgi:hypothetical protein